MQPEIIFITLNRKKCKNESNCDVGISISKDQVNEKCFPGFYAFGLYQNEELKNEELRMEKFKIGATNKFYNNVYKFEDGINAKNVSVVLIKSFYWDKKEGLIRYDNIDGEVFELFKKE